MKRAILCQTKDCNWIADSGLEYLSYVEKNKDGFSYWIVGYYCRECTKKVKTNILIRVRSDYPITPDLIGRLERSKRNDVVLI